MQTHTHLIIHSLPLCVSVATYIRRSWNITDINRRPSIETTMSKHTDNNTLHFDQNQDGTNKGKRKTPQDEIDSESSNKADSDTADATNNTKNEYLTSFLPKRPSQMTRMEVGEFFHMLERTFIDQEGYDYSAEVKMLSKPQVTKKVYTMLTGLSDENEEIKKLMGLSRIAHDITSEELKRSRDIAKEVGSSNDIAFCYSELVEDLLENDLDECEPASLHLLHFLQVESGWSLTSIGMEDCSFVGHRMFCIVRDEDSEDLKRLNKVLFHDDGFMLGPEMPFKHKEINPLDNKSWREWESTPFPLDDQDPRMTRWTSRHPINLEELQSLELGSLIRSLYTKLDETTTYKNDLVRKLLSVHEENEALTKRVKEQKDKLEQNNKRLGETRPTATMMTEDNQQK